MLVAPQHAPSRDVDFSNGISHCIGLWNITVEACQDSTAVAKHITMQDLAVGNFHYRLTLHTGQILQVGRPRKDHPAAKLPSKFKQMVPFLCVEGKPSSSAINFVVVKTTHAHALALS